MCVAKGRQPPKRLQKRSTGRPHSDRCLNSLSLSFLPHLHGLPSLICLSVCLSTHPSIRSCLDLFHMSLCLPIHISISFPGCKSIYPSIHRFIDPSIRLSTRLPASPSSLFIFHTFTSSCLFFCGGGGTSSPSTQYLIHPPLYSLMGGLVVHPLNT